MAAGRGPNTQLPGSDLACGRARTPVQTVQTVPLFEITATAKLIVFSWSFPLDFFNWGGAENDKASKFSDAQKAFLVK
jgi:hypothetical protein